MVAGQGDGTEERSQRVALLVDLLKLASLISRPMQDKVADVHGVTSNELRLLMSLGGIGEAASHELARLLAMHPMNVSRAVHSLRLRGWVAERRDPANRRRKPLALTDEGRAARRALTPQVAEVADQLLRRLTGDDERELSRLLKLVIVELEAPPVATDSTD